MPLTNAHVDISRKSRGLNFGLSFPLHEYECEHEGSGESPHNWSQKGMGVCGDYDQVVEVKPRLIRQGGF